MVSLENKIQSLKQQFKNGLIVSCQPVSGGPMDKVEHIVAMALAAEAGGAAGLRVEGAANVAAVAQCTRLPIVGIVKRDLTDSPVRITPYLADVQALADAGAAVIAVDGTNRIRPCAVSELLTAIHQAGCASMADCDTLASCVNAAAAGAVFIGTTMSGYTGSAVTPTAPDLALVRQLAALELAVIAEGRYNSPALAAEAIRAGALCVTVGSAITRLEHITQWFHDAICQAGKGSL